MTKTLQQQVAAIDNLTAFSLRTGIPRRTLNRVKASADHVMNATTRMVLEAALKKEAKRSK